MISEACRQRIAAERARFPEPRAALLGALRAVQDERGWISREAAEGVARLLDLAPIEVWEVVAFYPLFRTRPAGRAHIQVCTGLPCCLRGARRLVRELEGALGIRAGETTGDGRFSLAEVECLGSCGTAPVVQVNDLPYREQVTPELVAGWVREGPEAALAEPPPAPLVARVPAGVEGYILPAEGAGRLDLDAYRARGGYRAWERARGMAPEEIAREVETSGLRGRGGAGFVAGKKWSFMPRPDGGPRYLAVNADESEPGTFKDRQILERNPHLLIEGILIAARAVAASAAHLYMRGEYASAHASLVAAREEAYAAGLLGPGARGDGAGLELVVQRGAGAYICGEETGMLESIEGKKGQPRKRPPYPAVRGLWGRPTTVQNVETLSHLPAIVARGAAWFRTIGRPQSTGHALYGISGHVERPGVYELPLGTTVRELIEHAGGTLGGRAVKAVVPGGVSMPVLTGDQLDVTLDHESLRAVGSLLGTAGVIVMDERTCMVRAALVVARFFRHESCGQCTQCREGTGWLYRVFSRLEAGEAEPWELEAVLDVSRFMDGQTICALSDAAAWSARAFLTRFGDEFAAHARLGSCPLPESFEP